MAWGKNIKTEHGGAKNGGGMYATRAWAKVASNKRRRNNDRQAVREYDGS